MAKKLVTKNDLQEQYCRSSMTFTTEKGMILTQSALDFAREYQIKITYKTASGMNNSEHLVKRIKSVLKESFGIEDERILREVLNKING